MTEPDPFTLADDEDELGWERPQHGRMAEQQADDDAVPTVPWEA